ncbi:MAG: Ig-like domain-containing protein, partial [Actinomycetota bacterium]|nr:Ig-like domain-containing protein [Actinomycetota bacterium]
MTISYTIENRGTNYIVPVLKAGVRIVDQSDKELINETRDINSMLPGTAADLGLIWNTGLNLPGEYTSSLEVRLDGKVVSSNSAAFSILPVTLVTGYIKATPPVVIYGNQVLADYSAGNAGNMDIVGLPLRVLVLDPATQTVMNSFEDTLDLAIDGSVSGRVAFLTQGYGLKTYEVVLQYLHQGTAMHVASTAFTVIDGAPPMVNIISPVAGRYYNAQFDLSVTAMDDISGVDRVQYRVDGGSWRLLPIADSSSGRYSTTWIPEKIDEGPHTINFRAIDRAGNTSITLSTAVTIDLTPPDLTVSTLADGSWTNNEVLNVAGNAIDN